MKTKYHLLYLSYNYSNNTYEPKICLYDKNMEVFSASVEDLWVNAYGDVIEIRMDLYRGNPHLIHNPKCFFFYSMPKRYCS